MTGQIVGYARVSSTSQNLARQLEALGQVDELFTDQVSGKNTDRPGLGEALRYVRRGGTLRVASMDRLARSLIDLEQLVTELNGRLVGVEFVKERLPFQPGSSADPFATFQRQLIAATATEPLVRAGLGNRTTYPCTSSARVPLTTIKSFSTSRSS